MADFSIVVPAYNEEEYLPATLRSAVAAVDSVAETGEIVVVDNNSTDRTAEIARQFGAAVVFEPVNQIARARNAGAAVATGKWLLFLDADTQLPPEILRQALAALASGRVCGGGAVTAWDKPQPGAVRMLLRLWNFLARRMKLAAGSFFFCLREGFVETGGFDEGLYAGEEVRFARRLKRWGRRRGLDFRILSDPPVVTSGRKSEWFNGWQLMRQLFLLLFFPLATRRKRLCALWYERPDPKLE